MKKFFLVAVLALSAIAGFSQSAPNSGTVMSAAYKQAAKEHKNVLVIFHASWCGWCKKMDASLNDSSIKKYFSDNYVIVHLTVQESAANRRLENPGADIFLAKYKAEKAGLPFFVIMDAKGNKLGDSFLNGANVGCPSAADEVAYFTDLLKKTSKIDDAGLQAISARFRLNEAK